MAKRVKPGILLVSVAWVMASGTAASGDTLVTRDDFVCYDTAHPFYTDALWPSVGIDSSGGLTQICFVDTRVRDTALEEHLYAPFDRFGNQRRAAVTFLPDTIADSVWETTGWYLMSCNRPGQALVPYCAKYRGGFVLRPFAVLFDTNGAVMAGAINLMDDPGHADMITDAVARVSGDINDSGTAVIAWQAYRDMQEEYDSVFVRQYWSGPDSLGPYLEPLMLPQPELEDPDPWWGGKFGIGAGPVTAVADDGDFVVAWEARYYEGYIANVLYVVYRADGTPRCSVQIANCLGGFQDTARCSCSYINTVDVAMAANGDFYVVWSGNVYAPSTHTRKHLWVRGFNADGTPKYDPLRVNDADTLNLWVMTQPQIACDDSGNLLVCWADARLHPDNSLSSHIYDVYLQRIDPEGNLIGPNMRVNNLAGLAGLGGANADCDVNDAGQSVVIWTYFAVPYRIQAQLMPLQDVGTFVPGDINADLSGDVADLTTLVDYIFYGGKNTFWPRDLVDFDGDGWYGIVADLTYLVAYLFQGGPPPVTPSTAARQPPPLPE